MAGGVNAVIAGTEGPKDIGLQPSFMLKPARYREVWIVVDSASLRDSSASPLPA